MSDRLWFMRFALCAAFAIWCCTTPAHNPPADVVWPTPTQDACSKACASLKRMHCANVDSPGRDDRYGTDDDVPCERACRDVQDEGIVTLQTECVAEAKTCAAASDCQ